MLGALGLGTDETAARADEGAGPKKSIINDDVHQKIPENIANLAVQVWSQVQEDDEGGGQDCTATRCKEHKLSNNTCNPPSNQGH